MRGATLNRDIPRFGRVNGKAIGNGTAQSETYREIQIINKLLYIYIYVNTIDESFNGYP